MVEQGAKGVDVAGDNAVINLSGTADNPAIMNVAGGSTGVEVTGNGTQLNIEHFIASITGPSSTGVQIDGNNTQATLAGQINATDYGTGIAFTGDNVTTTATLDGVINVTNAGTGISVTGNNSNTSTAAKNQCARPLFGGHLRAQHRPDRKNHPANSGDINVTLNGTGVMLESDNANVSLQGNVNVTAVKDVNGVLQPATGIVINGSKGTLKLDGNLNVGSIDIGATRNPIAPGDLRGLVVTGSDNTINLAGTVTLQQPGIAKGSQQGFFTALDLSGERNVVNVAGGVSINVDNQGASTAYGSDDLLRGINVSGPNTVTVSGKSSVSNTSASVLYGMFATASGGAQVLLDSGSELDVNFVTTSSAEYDRGTLSATGTGTQITNAGFINAAPADRGTLMSALQGATVESSGRIDQLGIDNDGKQATVMIAEYTGSTARNSGSINLRSTALPVGSTGVNVMPVRWASGLAAGVLGTTGGAAVNAAGGTITAQGAGLFNIAATGDKDNNSQLLGSCSTKATSALMALFPSSTRAG